MDFREDVVRNVVEAFSVEVGSGDGGMVSVTAKVDFDTWSSGELSPAQARALAALLLRHADRAEGRES